MICPACDRENAAHRRYCGKCGHNFRPCCRRCAFANDGDDRFCGGCGANLVASEGVRTKKLPPPPIHSAEAESQTQPVAVISLRSVPPTPTLPMSPIAVTAAAPRTKPPTPPPIPARAHANAIRAVPPATPPAHFPMPTADELDGLFTATVMPAKESALPASGVSQDDVDRLFGVTP